MSEKPRKITPSDGGVFQNFSDRIRLIMRLMADPRVNPLVKILPIGAMFYLFSFAAQWLYFIFAEWLLRGQTVGKRMFGLRVMDDAKAPIAT